MNPFMCIQSVTVTSLYINTAWGLHALTVTLTFTIVFSPVVHYRTKL